MTLLLFEDRFGHFRSILRCFDTVFQRPHRYFSIALKVVFSSSDRYEIFTSNWLWIEWIYSFKLNLYYYDNNKQKNFETEKSRILCDLNLNLLLKIQH